MKKQLKLWTRTNEYVVVIVDGERYVKADVQYHGSTPICEIEGITYVVSRIQG